MNKVGTEAEKCRQEDSAGCLFGIDVGGTTTKLGLIRPDGARIVTREIPTDTSENGARILPEICAAMHTLCEGAGIPAGQIAGAGIAVPGAVLPDGTVNRCVNLGWGRVELERELSGLLGGIPVCAANDANAAALGEMWLGAGRDHRNLCMVTIGTGLGGGIVLDGKIVTGAFGAAGEIGHIPTFDAMEEVCGCGNHGCLEQLASARGPVKLAEEALSADGTASVLRGRAALSAKEVFDAAGDGDAVALSAVEEYARILGRGLAQVSAVIDPELFVLGGGVAKAGKLLLEAVRRHYRNYAFHASRDAEFALAELGNEAGMIGAAKLAADRFLP